MAQKDMVHNSDITSRHSNHHNRNVLFVIGIAVIIGLAMMLVTLQPKNQSTAISSNVETIAYNNALEMQYAQPWLNAQSVKIAPAVQYTDALAMQYAQPWLDAQSIDATSAVKYTDSLAMQYAQPWLDAQSIDATSTVQYTNALEMQYAQPWLFVEAAPTVQYTDALAKLYAQPWLNAQQTANCNGRLDEMYACQNSQ